MSFTIALAGKGGTGKTTVAALLIKALLKHKKSPIFAIDADPATNLHMALGLPMPRTIGTIREGMAAATLAGKIGVAIPRQDYLTHEVRMALEEGDQIDLIAMGRPEGPGCYCAANHMLRGILDDLSQHYPYIVIDNEAGMEHISRRTTRDVDLLLLVSDPTIRGIHTAVGMSKLADSLEIEVRRKLLLINRLSGELTQPLQAAINASGMEIGARIPADEQVNLLDGLGEPLTDLDEHSPAWISVQILAAEILEESVL